MANGPDGVAVRRACLVAVANPAPWHDYLVCWAGTLAGGTRLVIDYVPDRQILVPTAFAVYLERLEDGPWSTLESLVVAVLDDFNNELVPRWIQVAADSQENPPMAEGRRWGAIRHYATADDRQPDWDNPGLLTRHERAMPGRS